MRWTVVTMLAMVAGVPAAGGGDRLSAMLADPAQGTEPQGNSAAVAVRWSEVLRTPPHSRATPDIGRMLRASFHPANLSTQHSALITSSPARATVHPFITSHLPAPDAVYRRGSESTLTGSVEQVDDNGVTIKSDLGAVHVVPWDRVRQVATDNPDRDSMVSRHMENAAALWRARSRVERMDVTLAEPLLERLFEQYRGATHETALVTAEGLLRCRLARGAHALAIVPALEVMRLRRAGVKSDSYAALPPVYDDATGLCPALAPVWFESPILRRVEQELRVYRVEGDELTNAVAALYAESVRRALGVTDGPALPATWPEGEGVRLMIDLLACGDSDSSKREQSRDGLLRRQSSLPVFARAWVRFHVGWSLLRESGVVRQQRGMLSLLHVPAVYGGSQPYLAGIALALVAGALEEEGSGEPAATLRGELDARFPFHPVRTARPAPVTVPPRT